MVITCYISKHSLICLSHSIYELHIVKVILQLGHGMVYIIIKGGKIVVYIVILYSSSIYIVKKISTVHRTGPKYFDKKKMIIIRHLI